jgi:predicted metal-binding membrane protein
MTNTRRPERAFFGTAALLFAASAAVTIGWCSSMSAMPGMEMPGGWTMSMAWMRMPGQTWSGAAATFLGMWIVMMMAMMLPALVPMLSRYREAVAPAGGTRLGWLTTLVGAGYFAMWTLCGLAVFAVGLVVAGISMRVPAVARALPIATGMVVLIAGVLQFTAWKKRQLACCRASPAHAVRHDSGTAFRHGLLLGARCIRCCLGPTAILLCVGIMDLRAMAIVSAAITAERLAPAGDRVARGIGMVILAAGMYLIATGCLAG